MLAAKNEIFDLDSQLLLARTEAVSLKEHNEALEEQLQDTNQELAGLKAVMQEVCVSMCVSSTLHHFLVFTN